MALRTVPRGLVSFPRRDPASPRLRFCKSSGALPALSLDGKGGFGFSGGGSMESLASDSWILYPDRSRQDPQLGLVRYDYTGKSIVHQSSDLRLIPVPVLTYDDADVFTLGVSPRAAAGAASSSQPSRGRRPAPLDDASLLVPPRSPAAPASATPPASRSTQRLAPLSTKSLRSTPVSPGSPNALQRAASAPLGSATAASPGGGRAEAARGCDIQTLSRCGTPTAPSEGAAVIMPRSYWSAHRPDRFVEANRRAAFAGSSRPASPPRSPANGSKSGAVAGADRRPTTT